MSQHDLFNPEGLPPAIGFSYGAASVDGRLLHIAGVTGHAADGSIEPDLVSQFSTACGTVAKVVTSAGGDPSDVVSMTIYTTDMAEYKEHLGPLGSVYREVFGRHYPPMALIGIKELMDPAARVELVCVAVVPD